MFSSRVVFLQVFYLVLMVDSQIPVSLPSPPILPGPQMVPPNVVAVGTISNGGAPDSASDTQPPSNASTVTSAPSIPSAPLTPQLPAPTNGSSGPPVQSTNQTLAVAPSNTSLPSSRYNGPPPLPSLPIPPATTSRLTNSSGGVSVEVDDFDTTNGTLPIITLVVSNVGNGTKISIKNNNKS